MRIGDALRVWRTTRSLGSAQTTLTECPCCFRPGAELLFNVNDYSRYIFVAPSMKRGRYSLCPHCGTLFAATRPKPDVAETYYDLFTSTQNNAHDTYPPKSRNSRGKIAAAKHMLGHLDAHGLLRPGMSVLHVRSDAGALLHELRQRIPDAAVYALDYFDPNLRWLNEQGYAAARLNSGRIEIPFSAAFDVIISNHILTHAIDPRGDLETMRRALNPGGQIIFYNEIDHDILFDPTAGDLFRRADIINYHKQLFVRESLEALLRSAGFDYRYVGHRKERMTYLAQQRTSNSAQPVTVAPDVVERQRRKVAKWQRIMRYRRPAITVKHTLTWLMRPPLKRLTQSATKSAISSSV
jgi:SAM-dependent methyltransferase